MFDISEDAIYRAIPEEEMYKICKNKVYLLEHMAKERGINVYISSWDSQTYDFLNKLALNSIILLPMWESLSPAFTNDDKARDGKHPGPKHHALWMNKIKDYIK